jgi:hypothetical protein
MGLLWLLTQVLGLNPWIGNFERSSASFGERRPDAEVHM